MRVTRRTSSLALAAALGAALIAAPSAGAVAPTVMPAQSVSGTGDAVPSLTPFREPAIVTLTHQGTSNFIVHPVNSAGTEGMSWANDIGNWTGTVFQPKESRAITAASVQADGVWTIDVKPLKSAPVVPTKSYQGAGTAVVKFKSTQSSPKRIALTHDGDSNFIVRPISSGGKQGMSIVNEIGDFNGSVVLPKGTRYLEVIADGTWTSAIASLKTAPVVPATGYTGTGKSVVKLPKATKKGKKVTLTHDGESNFIVRPLTSSGKARMTIVNEIGAYSGTRLLPSGTKYLQIDADGTWTVVLG